MAGGETPRWEADAVILAVPAEEAAGLVRPLDAPLADELAGIEFVSAATVSLGFERGQVDNPLRGYGLVIPRAEGRSVMGVTWSSSKFPGRAPAHRVLVRAFVGGVKGPALLALSDDELVSLVRREAADLLGARGEPVLSRLYRWKRAMPQYHVGHAARLERIHARLTDAPGRLACGGLVHGYRHPRLHPERRGRRGRRAVSRRPQHRRRAYVTSSSSGPAASPAPESFSLFAASFAFC